MDRKGNNKAEQREIPSYATHDEGADRPDTQSSDTIPDILDERIEGLREAIEEIDGALAVRRELNRKFVEQIDCEAKEVKRHLDMLPAPWRTGFQPEQRFLRLSFQRRAKSE